MVYGGLWFSTLNRDLMAFVESTQRCGERHRAGEALPGSGDGCRKTVAAFRSTVKTWRPYLSGDAFDHRAAEGFVKIWGLSTQVQARQQLHANDAPLLPQAKRLEAKRSRGCVTACRPGLTEIAKCLFALAGALHAFNG